MWNLQCAAWLTVIVLCAGLGDTQSVAGARSEQPGDRSIHVTLLGTGSPIPRLDRFGPSTLVEAGSEKLLFDVGRGATIRLWQRGVPFRDLTAVFLTHFHSDHVSGFPDLWLTGSLRGAFGQRDAAMRVYGPAGTAAMMAHLAQAYEADIRIRQADERILPAATRIEAEDITQGVVYERTGVKVTAFDVDHGDAIKPALGYRIDYAGRSVVLSGDTRVSANLVRFAAGADLLVHEVAAGRPDFIASDESARRVIGHHTTADQAGEVFSRVKPRLAVFTHIVLLGGDRAPTVDDVVRATRMRYAGPLEAGEDLMTIDVGDHIAVKRPSSTSRRPLPVP